ncbi:hypothetical protein OPQ81_007506 [Rhizoctonia solani]|nr:hypothetical protein OPQ81_007506 [Rhizoctonia solani]
MASQSIISLLPPSRPPTPDLKKPRKQSLTTRQRANPYPADSEDSSSTDSDSDYDVSETESLNLTEKLNPPLHGASQAGVHSEKQTTSLDTLHLRTDKPYVCSHAGCGKSYRKPSRLQEHERSHTGERPFVCSECGKSYLRDSHLRAHSRSHLPASARPFVCTYRITTVDPQPPKGELIPTQPTTQRGPTEITQSQTCGHRFWTAQHLRAHELAIHLGEKPYKCTLCPLTFGKHGALRIHLADSHAPPGTKPYLCEHIDCTQSFATNQKLKMHARVHDVTRYACAHPDCSNDNTTSIVQFSTWSLLQEHMRSTHPPKCPYPACNGRTFTSSKGLRGHIKTHRDRELEKWIQQTNFLDHLLREGVESFKSKKAEQDHVRVSHEGLRRFACPKDGCNKTFGYKHVMQRHLERHHRPQDDDSTSPPPPSLNQKELIEKREIIDLITGQDYDNSPQTSKTGGTRARIINCPWPDAFEMEQPSGDKRILPTNEIRTKCAFKFSRAYDLRRHLRSAHGLEIDAEEVNSWVLEHKRAKSSNIID